jgi:DNA replication protein DnaC
VGKTHLAYAAARHSFEESHSVEILIAGQLSRKVRMREPAEEHPIIDQWVKVSVLLLDDLGMGVDTAYSRQILQEILDRRAFEERAGLLVTSKYSLDALAQKMADDTIPSRLAGMCQILRVKGHDYRIRAAQNADSLT